MAKILKVTFIVTIIFAMTFIMTSCKNNIDYKEANECALLFFDAIEREDYEEVTKLFHPDKPAEERIRAYFENIEEEENVDFSKGIEVKRSQMAGGALYDSVIKGAYYKANYYVEVDDVSFCVEMEFAKNDDGFGLYNVTM